jgi:hypothetical protein
LVRFGRFDGLFCLHATYLNRAKCRSDVHS